LWWTLAVTAFAISAVYLPIIVLRIIALSFWGEARSVGGRRRHMDVYIRLAGYASRFHDQLRIRFDHVFD
jgi:hypothetical protein